MSIDRTQPSDALVKSFYDEIDTVCARHNALIRERPDLVVALFINMADGIRWKFREDVAVATVEDGKYMVKVGTGDERSAGMLGFKRRDNGEIHPSDVPEGWEQTSTDEDDLPHPEDVLDEDDGGDDQ